MSAEIIPFDFEEQAVRIVVRDDEPWFVAADVCRVLEIVNTSQAVQRLDEDEVTLCQIEGSHRETNLVSESGLYALVIRSDKSAARRFRKWITAEVLPAIRRHGRYEATPAPQPMEAGIDGLSLREAELWLGLVREARQVFGPRGAVALWQRSPLPKVRIQSEASEAEGRAALAAMLAQEIEGRALSDLIDAARAGEFMAVSLLAGQGLRILPDGLFIANMTVGARRAALLAVPGVRADEGVRTLSGIRARGIVVPFAVMEG